MNRAPHTVGDQTPGTSVTPPELSGSSPRRRRFRRWWPVVRFVLAIGVLGVAVWVLDSHTDELSGIPEVFDHLRWWWIPPAVAAEAASLLCFAGLQHKLLKTGGLISPKVPLVKMTFASQALANSLPGGTAFSAVYGFRWFRRFGAGDTLAVWAMSGTVIAAMVSLSLVAAAGLALAAGEGASLDLIPVLIGVLVVTISVGALFVYERPLFFVASRVLRLSQSLVHRPRGDVMAQVDRIMAWATSVQLGWREVIGAVAWALGNWLFDCACFAMMFPAVGASVPWKGLLLAYGAGQLAAALPITPGGLGAVEGSITIALVAFGGAHVATVDAVLIYRLISFWLVLAVGWLLWGELALEVRRGRWKRHALAAPVVAGPASTGGADPGPSVDIDGVTVAGS